MTHAVWEYIRYRNAEAYLLYSTVACCAPLFYIVQYHAGLFSVICHSIWNRSALCKLSCSILCVILQFFHIVYEFINLFTLQGLMIILIFPIPFTYEKYLSFVRLSSVTVPGDEWGQHSTIDLQPETTEFVSDDVRIFHLVDLLGIKNWNEFNLKLYLGQVQKWTKTIVDFKVICSRGGKC